MLAQKPRFFVGAVGEPEILIRATACQDLQLALMVSYCQMTEKRCIAGDPGGFSLSDQQLSLLFCFNPPIYVGSRCACYSRRNHDLA